ncbi:uncharacterized protein [Rutidosis leptorrhynchoides]|uniref:uncharacterized protein n=1 Tax=Rutidosis leptorrhynchoides TaxID=125765 RepID=UPI003A98FA3A
MDFNSIQQEHKQPLITHNNYYHDQGGITTVKVVEYMLSSMSSELLTKFPDNSAFDFDYTQSSIWSPLVPHPSNPNSPASELQRSLSFDDDEEFVDDGSMSVKKFTKNVKDKISGSCLLSCFKMKHKFSNKKVVVMKRRKSSFRGFDQLGPYWKNSMNVGVDSGCSSPIQNKGWKKVLKAASKQFKKTMKKKDVGAHLRLSSNGYSQFSY